MKTMLTAVAAAALLLPAGVAHAQEANAQGSNWIHVRVDETDGARVRVNFPASMVDVALEMADTGELRDGHLRLDSTAEVSVQQIRRLWREMRDAGDAEFVNVQDGDEHVRVFRKGDRVYVHVDEAGEEKVRVQMPAEVADALLDSEGDRLNVQAAVQRLARAGSQELVRVRDEDATVRVWVDGRNSQDETGGAP